MTPNNFIVLLPCSLEDSFELLLSRAIDLRKDEENSVTVLYCKGAVNRFCMSNPLGLKTVCRSCVYVSERAITDFCLQSNAVAINIKDYLNLESKSICLFSSSSSFRESIELSVSSTLGSLYQTNSLSAIQAYQFLPLRLLVRSILEQAAAYSSIICNSIEIFLEQQKANIEVNIYNGRYYPYMPIRDLCRTKKIDYCIIEFIGKRCSEMWISRNVIPHSLAEQRSRLEAALLNPQLNESDGHSFFQNRRAGIPTTDVSFTADRSSQFGLPKQKKLVSIFLSSPYEFIAFGDEWLAQYSLNPVPFILSIREGLPSNYLVCVRFHPNQKRDRSGATQIQIEALNACKNLVVVPPESPISSYSILDQSSYSITLGSTMGLEATYWNIPSIEAGIQIWSHLSEVIYSALTPEEALRLILNQVPPKSRELATRIGSYLMNPPRKNETCFSRHPHHSYSLCCGFSYLKAKRLTLGFLLNKLISTLFAQNPIFGKKI